MRRQQGHEKTLVDRLRVCQRSTPANKKCADCSQRGPTYICLDFQTFICQTCSGIHREFGHKIKSISLSEWALWEVESVEAGGNDRAAQEWLCRWDKEAYPEPDGSQVDKVREFIKLKYEEKMWWVQQPICAGKGLDAPQFCTAVTRDSSLATHTTVVSSCSEPSNAMMANVGDLLSGELDACIGPQWAADFSSNVAFASSTSAYDDVGSISTSSCTVSSAGHCFTSSDFSTFDETPLLATLLFDSKQECAKDHDRTSELKSPVSEPAEEPSPILEAASAGVKANLRQGHSPPKTPVSPDRYAALDELVGDANRNTPNQPGMFVLPPSMLPARTLSAAAQPSMEVLRNKQVCAGVEGLVPDRLAQLMSEENRMPSPQQLDRMSSQDLLQMHAMVLQALQARVQPAAALPQATAPAPPTEWPVKVVDDPRDSMEFGDLLPIFHARNPIAGIEIRA